ncbi:hypothetical protein V7654_03710, partial [Bacillus sp. JJ1609]|uniref:hypothetical protein n=1 Tax=Bacillus sp. JJ1609 TaxID=3122977 RepID=UPI002FFFE9E2
VTLDSTTKYVSSDSRIVINNGSVVASNLAPDGLTAMVTFTYGGVETAINVQIKKTEVIVESLTASSENIILAPGETVPFTITANLSDGTTKNITLDILTKYISSHSRIVINDGTIVASNLASNGLTATITVTYDGVETTINVQVKL